LINYFWRIFLDILSPDESSISKTFCYIFLCCEKKPTFYVDFTFPPSSSHSKCSGSFRFVLFFFLLENLFERWRHLCDTLSPAPKNDQIEVNLTNYPIVCYIIFFSSSMSNCKRNLDSIGFWKRIRQVTTNVIEMRWPIFSVKY